jgi:hypothetical protein
LLLALLAAGAAIGADPPLAAYGTKVTFGKDAPIRFKDFELTYVGQHRETTAVYPRGFLYHDFRVVSGGVERKVSWTAGTGEVGPARFELPGGAYLLELVWSETAGRLSQDQLVIRPVAPAE